VRIEATAIPAVRIVVPTRHVDARGFFEECYSQARYAEAGVDAVFVQDNRSLSVHAGTVRGLHFQLPPFAQDKLVWCVRGAILDVAVDLRAGSPTYGRHVAVGLSAADGRQLYVPAGFAHGFCTTEPNTEVCYKVSSPYSPEHDRGLRWNDPALAIAWPVAEADAVLSDKDRRQPLLAEI
jgi:dTDP-4-dehydrorhamnose 3,5-epimerase